MCVDFRMARGELLVLARAGQVGEERKRVLKICVSKLQTIHDPEAFLCRSVLINNTLRQIQEEHRQGQRRARLKRSRHVVEEEEGEEEEVVDDRRVQISVDNLEGAEGEGVSKRFCPELQQVEAEPSKVNCLISSTEGCPMSTAYYEDGIYKEEVLLKENCSDSLDEDGDEVDEEDDETDEDEEEDDDEDEEEGEEEEEEEEVEDGYDLPLEETPMLGSIEISVVSSAFTNPERKTEEELRLDQLPDEDETSSSSEEGGGAGLYHCPYSLLLPSSQTSQPLPSLNCAL